MPETTKTRMQLVDQVLTNLGVLVPGQAPSAETRSKVDDILDPAIASLRARDICYIPETGDIGPSGGEFPVEFFLALAASIANYAAPSFNLAGDAKLFSLAQQAEGQMMTLSRPDRTRKTLKVDRALTRTSFPIRAWPNNG